MEKYRKIVPLTGTWKGFDVSGKPYMGNEFYPNLIKEPISPIGRFLIEPYHAIAQRVKVVTKTIIIGLILLLAGIGAYSCYLAYHYYAGYLEITILSQGDMKLLSSDLLKPKNETKNKTKP